MRTMLQQCNHAIFPLPVPIIKTLHKQGVYVRPGARIENQSITNAFIMDEQGREKEIVVLLKCWACFFVI